MFFRGSIFFFAVFLLLYAYHLQHLQTRVSVEISVDNIKYNNKSTILTVDEGTGSKSESEIVFASVVVNTLEHVPRINHNFTNITLITEWKSHPLIPRPLSLEQYEDSMLLLEELVKIIKSYDIEFIMADGTLLGSYFFHDMIPWDDDLDILVRFKDRPKLLDAFKDPYLRKTYGVRSYHSHFNWYSMDALVNGRLPKEELQRKNSHKKKPDYKVKFYRLSSNMAGREEWHFPFVDIKFYEQTRDKIRTLDNVHPQKFKFKVDDFYPLHSRPFGPLSLPAPRNTMLFLKSKFKLFRCRSHEWDHINERGQSRKTVSCSSIFGVYPHVKKVKYQGDSAKVNEILYLGDHLIHSVVTEEAYTGDRGLFHF